MGNQNMVTYLNTSLYRKIIDDSLKNKDVNTQELKLTNFPSHATQFIYLNNNFMCSKVKIDLQLCIVFYLCIFHEI